MEGKIYWQEFLGRTRFGLPLEISNSPNVLSEFVLPAVFNIWCKGNVNNGKLLLLSIVRELFFVQNWNISLSFQHNQLFFPVDTNGCGDFRTGAKSLIEDFRKHIEQIDSFQNFDLFGVVISDSKIQNNSQYPILLVLSEDCSKISIDCSKTYESFCDALLKNIYDIIVDNNHKHSTDLVTHGAFIMDEISKVNVLRKSLLASTWELIFHSSIQWNKSYYANGGDSIQAIRLLSKLKEQGAKVDLTGLLNAINLELWTFEVDTNYSLNLVENKDFPERYLLTEMQEKIWSHFQSYKEHGAYHEQFLFELIEYPNKDVIESCINAIWKSYPNLRVKIVEINGKLFQEVQDNQLVITEEYIDSIELALANDLKLSFSETLLRLKLIHISEKSYLLWSHHHVILDGWSVGILIQEFIKRISEQNFQIQFRPNYQYILKNTENELIERDTSLLISSRPFLFEINYFDPLASFETVSFDLLEIQLEKEKLITENLKITNQLLHCGIAGLVLKSLTTDSNFYFNGISSGRDLLNRDVDHAVGLFIRNIQIPISLDNSSTWRTFFSDLDLNFQKHVSNTQISINGDYEVSNSDFLFVYENYPYTNLKTSSFEAELIHVNEVTGYPITFCLFPNAEGYSLRIVYDARRFDSGFINRFKLKFEQIYNQLITSHLEQTICISPEMKSLIGSDCFAIDSLNKTDLDEVNKNGLKISFPSTKGWSDLFTLPISNNDDETFTTISFWRQQFLCTFPGIWNNEFLASKGCSFCFTSEGFNDTNQFLTSLSVALKQLIWKESGFQIVLQKNGVLFPFIVEPSFSDSEISPKIIEQMRLIDRHIFDYQELLKNRWDVKSNFLVLIDSDPTQQQLNDFEFILIKKGSELICYKSETISSEFADRLQNLLSSQLKNSNDFSDSKSIVSNQKNELVIRQYTFIERFNQSLKKNPSLLAVDDGECKYTYSQLDINSNRLANYINENYDLSKENFIGIQLAPSADQLCAIIAVLKVKKAFVPIDIFWPSSRIEQIVKQAGIDLIINQEIINGAKLSEESINLEYTSQLTDPIYSLFTSGSTGLPKGCVISEFAFSNYLNHCDNNYFKHSEKSRIHVFTPLSFDFTLTSLLGGIAFGLTVVIHNQQKGIYDSLNEALQDNNSLVIKLTPSHIQLCEFDWLKNSSPKMIIVGGEALTNSHIEKCLFDTSHRLINEYGPTEATVGCVFQEILLNQPPLIGLPIEGTGVLVVNEKNELVVKGREGELCLFGNGLAEGYLNDPIRTSSAFLTFNIDNKIRIYKTGDIVKMQQNGELIYIGRKDQQVKLNGYRIEVDEIRIWVKELTTFESQTILIEQKETKQLVCFVAGELNNFSLESALRNRLPAYMVPAIFIEINSFPVTSNGKLDILELEKIYFKRFSNLLNPTPVTFDFKQMLEKWENIDLSFKSMITIDSIRKNGWEQSFDQLELLYQVSHNSKGIYFPESCRLLFPKTTNVESTFNDLASVVYNNQSVSVFDFIEYSKSLEKEEICFPENYGYLFSKTIQKINKLECTNQPVEIESKYLPFLKVNDVVLVTDWTNQYGFPFIIKKNSLGQLLTFLPNSTKKVVRDTLNLSQLSGCKGQILEIQKNNYDFIEEKQQIRLMNNLFIQRFSYRLSIEYIESLVYKNFKNCLCVLAIEKQDLLFVLIHSTSPVDVKEIYTMYERYLPTWCKVKEVYFTSDVEAKVKELFDVNYDVADNNSDFQSFLSIFLPEYSYLQGNLSLIEQGGDSITALRIVGRLKNKGFQIEVGGLLNATSIATYLLNLVSSLRSDVSSHLVQLTPIQEWFLTEYKGNKNHFNQSILLELLIPVDPYTVCEALTRMLEHQTILSSVYNDGWKKGKAPKIQMIQCTSEEEVTAICNSIQQSFDIEQGPVSGGAMLLLNDKVLLFVAIHHLYCDGYSWRIILDDLQASLNGISTKKDSTLAFGKTKNQFLELYKKNKEQSISFYGNKIMHPFMDFSHFTYAESNYLEWEWSIEETKWFQMSHEIGTTANEKFLFLFLKTWIESRSPSSTVFLETHGRFYSGVSELTDSIGWFTQFYPIFSKDFPVLDNLKDAISSQFENLPENGLTYMGETDWMKPPFPILLNFLGNFDENRGGIAVPSTISQGEMTDSTNPTLSFVELNAMIIEGKMKWMLRMHPSMDAILFKDILNKGVKELMSNTVITDYVAQSIDQDDLDAINNLLGGI